jgi:cytoskeletal protein RodZ
MQSTTKKQKHKKIFIIISSVALLFVVVYSTTAYATNLWPFQASTKDTPASEAKESTSSPEDSTDNSSNDNTSSSSGSANKTDTNNSDPQATTSTDEASGKTIVSVVTSVDISSNTVYIRGGINNAVGTDGTCYALLTGPDGTTTQKDTTLLQNPSTVDCKTIQIDATSLTKGVWTYTLNYSSNTYEGTSDEATFTVN